jgi:NitT/TauT family transport system permease protein
MRAASDRLRRVGLGLLSVGATIACWQILSGVVFHSVLFPSATETASTLVSQLHNTSFLSDLRATLYRVLVGFALGSAGGTVLGLAVGSIRPVRALCDPYLNFFRFVTPIAWIAPATIWFGIGDAAKLFLVVYATIFIVVINTMHGVGQIHRDRVRMARVFGANAPQLFARVTVPATVPFILVGMRIGLGNSFMTVIGAEMLSGSNGLGHLIYASRIFFQSNVMFATIVILGILGFLSDRIFVVAERRFFMRYQPAGMR